MKAPNATCGAIFSMSTSAHTMLASLPPSSSVTRLSVLAASAMIFLPVAMLPVKLIFWIPGWLTSQGPSLSSPPSTCTTPGGRIDCAISTSFRAVYGVKGLGLTMIQLPVTSAGAILPTERVTGKFQGTMAPTIPRGTYLVVMTLSSSSTRSSGSFNEAW